MKYIIITGIFFSMILVSCEYNFSETNYVNIEQNPVVEVPVVSLSDIDPGDTVYIFKYTEIYYSVELDSLRFYEFEVTLDDSLIFESDFPGDRFSLNPQKWASGYYKLDITAKINSGNKSLADIYGKDTIAFTDSRILYIDGMPPDPINIRNIYSKDGSLVIKWDEYKKENFKCYYLIRNYSYNSSSQWSEWDESTMTKITDRTQTQFIDSSYIGGNAYYYIKVVNYTRLSPYSGYLSTSGEKSYINDTAPELKYTWIDDYTVNIYWTEAKYYNNFDYYSFRAMDDRGEYVFSKYDTASLTMSLKVPGSTYFYLATVKGDYVKTCSGLKFDGFTKDFYNYWGISFNYAKEIAYVAFDDYKVVNVADYSLKSTISTLDHNPFKFIFSENGNYGVSIKGTHVMNYSNGDISNTAREISIGTYYAGSIEPGSISNNGYFACSYATYYYIMNLNTNTIKSTRQDVGSVISAQISKNGDYYIVLSGAILKSYSFNDTALTVIKDMINTEDYTWFSFSHKYNSIAYLYRAKDKVIEVRDCSSNFSIIVEYPWADPDNTLEYLYFDPITETLLGIDNADYIHLINLEDGTEILKLYLDWSRPYYYNGSIFFRGMYSNNKGSIYKIPILHED